MMKFRPTKSGIFGDILKLVSGTTVAQLLAIFLSPLLTRLYAPEALGTLALFISITSILGVIACMRYELTIMLPESDEEAANLLGVSLSSAVLVFLLIIPVVVWGSVPVTRLLRAPELSSYLWLVPPMVLFSGVFLAFKYWNSRTKHFGRLSIAQINHSIATYGIKLAAGYMEYATSEILVFAQVIGKVIVTGVLGWQIWRDDQDCFKSIKLEKMVAGLRRYRQFPLLGTWSALLNTASWQLPTFLLSFFFSPVIVGYYALGNRILRIPMSFIGGALAQVFFQRASEAKNSGAIAVFAEEIFVQLVRFGLFPAVMLTFIGKDLFVIVFGENWAEAGVYVQILSLWTFFWFISSPLSTLFSVLERQDLSLRINIAIFVSRLLALGVGGYLGNARVAVFLFGISGILVYGYLNMVIMHSVGVGWRVVVKILLVNVRAVFPSILLLIGALLLQTSAWTSLGIAMVSSCVYGFYMVKTEPQIGRVLRQICQGIFQYLRQKQ
jgi:O-antigen/teichoic acid export membrane protein